MKENYYTEVNGNEFIPAKPDDKEALERYYKNLGEKIKKAREEEGLTQSKLAERIGMTPTALANYEAGIRQIPIHILLDIARFTHKPIHYFFGPNVAGPLQIKDALKRSIERFTQATYIDAFYELKDGKFEDIEQPEPMIPVPTEIAKDYHFALRNFNENTGTYDYYLCKWYKAVPKNVKFSFFKSEEYPIPNPDNWIIGMHGDTFKSQLMQFKDIEPYKGFKSDEKNLNEYTVNINAIVLARIERLVK